MNKNLMKKLIMSFPVVFLPMFMALIFGPAEIFFANMTEFEFIYQDFAGYLAAAAIGTALAVSLVLALVPEDWHRFCMAVIFGGSLAGYIQIMFLNRNLDLLGAGPEGYQIRGGAVANLIIWLVVIVGVIVLCCRKKGAWGHIALYGSLFLLSIQAIAWISLMVSADREAYVRTEGEGYHLSGAEQYTVSSRKNIILVVLDNFSNKDLEQALVEYPDLDGFLNDFTFYSNADCNYYGTYPSLPHFLSGRELDMSLKVNEWCYEIWNNEETQDFYDMLHENNYKTNLYTPNTIHVCGSNDPVILKEEFSNLVDSSRNVDIFYKLLFKTIVKMSGYRMAPELLKPIFYTRGDEYGDIVSYTDPIDHNNYDFYESLLDRGLETDEEHNYFIVQHLVGLHENTTGTDGHFNEEASCSEAVKGCMVIMEEYLNQLKKAGVYDDAVFIITSDHGNMNDAQVIFYMKEPGERHDAMRVTNAPISLSELQATLAWEAGMDSASFGPSVHDFSENEQRERTNWIRGGIDGYPFVPHYAEDRDGNSNVWQGYTYVGDREDFYQKLEEGPDIIVPMVDSFY